MACALTVVHGWPKCAVQCAGSLGCVSLARAAALHGKPLQLRGGRDLQDLGDLKPMTEGPEPDSDPIPEEIRTVDMCDGDEAGSMDKTIIREGKGKAADDYESGNGDMPLEGDLVSVRITISTSAGKAVATTEDLLQLADNGAAGASTRAPVSPVAAHTGKEPECFTQEEAEQAPLQAQYAYGGPVRVIQLSEARALPGAYSFRLGAHPDNIVPGIEEALMRMRRGEVARVTLSGRKGFDGPGFNGIAREWGIEANTTAVAELELVDWNTIDACGDGGVLLTLPHTSALEIARMREVGQWRLLARRPSSQADVLVRYTIRTVHHCTPGIGNSSTTICPDAPNATNPVPECARWVKLGRGVLPWGTHLRVCVYVCFHTTVHILHPYYYVSSYYTASLNALIYVR